MNARSRLSVAGTWPSRSVGPVAFAPLLAQAPAAKPNPPAPAAKGKPWVVPRTPDGKPDLQGNWTNETQTPLERMGTQGATLTDDEAAAIEERAQGRRGVPRQGERSESSRAAQGRRRAQARARRASGRSSSGSRKRPAARSAATTASGSIPGDKVIRIDGVARSSIIIDPPNGRLPALTDAGKKRLAETRPRAPRSSASSITPRCGRWPIAACCRSARTPGRRCCRTTSTTTTTPSCRPRIT